MVRKWNSCSTYSRPSAKVPIAKTRAMPRVAGRAGRLQLGPCGVDQPLPLLRIVDGRQSQQLEGPFPRVLGVIQQTKYVAGRPLAPGIRRIT